MTFVYRCHECGEVEADRPGVRHCPRCAGPVTRVYTFLYSFSRRGWTDVPPDARYENWTPEQKRMTLQRGT